MMNAEHELTLHIDPLKPVVKVEETVAGIVSRKEIPADALYECIVSSIRRDALCSGLLPPNCLAVTQTDQVREVVLWYPELRVDVSYYKTAYPNFPLPRLVFSFQVNRDGQVLDKRLGVIRDETPKANTPMFCYPFSNVNRSAICTGNNPLPKYNELRTIATLPRHILGLPNNDDMYDNKRNKLGMGYRDLLEHLKDRDPAYYYDEVLIPNGFTLKDFIERRF